MTKPFNKLSQKMSPASQTRADALTEKMPCRMPKEAVNIYDHLRPYVAWTGDDPENGGAALIFARNAATAKVLAYKFTSCGEGEFISVRVRRLREYYDYLEDLGLEYGKWHPDGVVVDDPPPCKVCNTWGSPPKEDGNGCEYCGGS